MASELHEYWCEILGSNQSVLTGSLTRQSEGILTTSLTLRSPVTIRALSGWGRGEIAVCSCSSDSERFGQLMHRLPGHSKPAQLFLPYWAELRGFGGRQMPGATGFSGCGARSRPSSSSSSARLAMMAAIARPVGVAVSTPSRKTCNVIRRSPRSAMVRVTSATDRPSRSIAATPRCLRAGHSRAARPIPAGPSWLTRRVCR
jgi:hypothetical protein